MEWLTENYTWIFSGLGNTIFSFIIGFSVGKKQCKNNTNLTNSNDNKIVQM